MDIRKEGSRIAGLIGFVFLASAGAAPAADCPRAQDGLCHCGDRLTEGSTYVIDPTEPNYDQKVAALSQCSGTALRLEANAVFDGAGSSTVVHEIDGPGCGAEGECVANICEGGPIEGRWCSGAEPLDGDIGFDIDEADGAVVRHVKVYGFYDGFRVRDSTGASLQHVFAMGNGVDGTTVDCSTSEARCGYGIKVVGSVDTALRGVDVRFSSDEGIHVSESTRLTVDSYVWVNDEFSFLGCSIVRNTVKCSGRENIYLLDSSDDATIKSMATNYAGCGGSAPLPGKGVSVLIRDSDRVKLAASSFDDARILFVRDSNDGTLDDVVVRHTDRCVVFENRTNTQPNSTTLLTPNGNRIQNSELYCGTDEDHVRSTGSGEVDLESGQNEVCTGENEKAVNCFNLSNSQSVACSIDDPLNLIELNSNCP